jgi:uncharacterized repeat protein (TIGR01451 family)
MKTVSDLVARAARLLLGAALALLGSAAFAQTVSTLPNFAQRYTTNASGDIRIVGNTMMTCTAPCPTVQDGTNANLNNNSYTMLNVDVDTVDTGLNGFNNSSSADFSLPPGATILKAYLYWYAEGSGAAITTQRGQVKLRTSPLGSYTTVTASNIYQQGAPAAGIGYASVADVTSLVPQGSTTFTVAGMATQTGVVDTYGGWSLVLVLADPAEPFRKLTVFDGLKQVGSGVPATINLSLGANATPPVGAVSMRMGVVAGEGDRGTVGDAVAVRSYASPGASPNAYTTLNNDAGVANNFFNSSITRLNTNVAAKNPNHINQLGVDMDVFDVPNAGNAVIQNSTNALDINLTSTGDVFLPSVVTAAVQLYVPNVQQDMVKTVVDLNGGDVQPGDILEYTIAFSNTGGDFADAAVLNDPIPANTTYVPGSLRTALGPPLADTARSDAAGDDTAAYYPGGCPAFNASPCVRAYLGSGATALAGGTINPGGPSAANSQVRFRFRVQVNAAIALGTLVSNSASISYTARTLGQTFTVTSPAATVTNGPANLRLTKTHIGDFQQGQSNAAYTITVINDGGLTTAPFTVTDTLPTGMTFASASGTNWACSPVGQVVTCQNSNAAPLALSGTSTISLLVNVAPTATSPVLNTATASGGGELAGTTGNNTATDSTTITGAPNLTITKVHTGDFNVSQTGRTYTLTVTNSGTALTTGTVTVVDTPPAGMSVTAITGTGWACTLATRTCTRADALGAAQVYPVITVTATMPATSGTYDQVATVSGGGELFTADNTATDPTLVLAAALDFQVTKSHTGNFFQGQVGATYSVIVTNSSASNSGGSAQFTVVDTPPAGMTITAMSGTGWTCTVGTATCTRTAVSSLNGGLSHPPITVTVTVASNAGSPLVNSVTSTPSGVSGDSNAANNTDVDSTIIEPRIDLLLTKTASSATPLQGVPFDYTLTVSNTSINSATGVAVLDLLPPGLTLVSATPSQGSYNSGNGAWAVGTVAAGGAATLTLNVTPTVTGAIVNTAQVLAADQIDSDSTPNNSVAAEDDQASVTVTVSTSVQLVVAKTTSTANLVNTSAGATATYTVTVSNPSTVNAVGVKLIDALPAGFTYASTTSVTLNGTALAASAYQAITTGAQTASTPQWDSNPSAGFTINAGQSLVIVFNATLASSVADATYNNSAAATSTSVGVQITNFDGAANTTDNVVVTSAVLATTKTTSTPTLSLASAGGTATYTVTLSNSGSAPATGVKVVDVLPAGFTYDSTTSVTLNGTALAASAYLAVTTGAQTTATPQWDSNPSAGFTINAGQSLVIVFNAAIAAGTADGVYNNSATTTGAARSIANFNGALNTSDDVTVTSAVLAVTKTTSTPSVLLAGGPGLATYTVTVSNSGGGAATGVKLTDSLPAGFTYAATTSVTLNGAALAGSAYQALGTPGAPQWDSNPTGGFTINAGQSLVVVFDATIAASTVGGVHSNSANATGAARVITNFNGAASTADDVLVIAGVNVSGTAYADGNHNAQRDGGEVGIGQNLYAKLVPAATPAGPATKVVSVDAGAGAYTFAGVSAGEYIIVLDDNNILTDITPTPPAGWLGTQMPNGIRGNVVVTNADLQNQDFGLYRGSRLSGRVFEDNGIGAGVPNNGVQDGGELGLARVTVRASTGDTALTDGGGNYTLWIPVAGPAIAVNVIETNLSGHLSVGGAVGNTGGAYVRSTDTVSLSTAGGSVYSGVNFADVRENALANNGQQTTGPGNVVFYAHTFTPGTGGTVSFTIAALTSPSTVSGFTQILHQDSNCNGVLDAGEPVLSGAVAVQAKVPLCVIVKETVPGGAPQAATDNVTLTANFTYTNAAPALTASHSNVDVTTVGVAGALNLVKSQNTSVALPGANLVYTIDYTNNGAAALSNIVVNDATPTYTRFVSASCVAPLPAGITGCSVTTQPSAGATGTIAWTLVGNLAPSARGHVRFTVQVDP